MKYKKILIFFIFIGLGTLIIAYPFRYRIKNVIKRVYTHFKSTNTTKSSSCPDCDKYFVDNVIMHEQAYEKEGIEPQKNKKGLKKLLRAGKLKVIKSNKFYRIDNLKHSSPYLMPKAVNFLEDLSKNYKDKCKEKKIQFVPFTVSSLTRTKTDVIELMNVNKNAITNSSHLKGKTFDINYRAFYQNKKQIKCFITSLLELRKKNRCFVKFERNGCLHITVN